MNLNSTIVLFAYGTSEGVTRAWDTRGRGRKSIPTDVHNYVQSFKPIFDKVSTQFKATVGQLGTVEGRLKTEDSVQEKMERKGEALNEIHDVAGLRVTVKSISDVYKAVGLLKGQFKVMKDDDKIETPKGAYRAYHLDVDVDGRPVELQVRTQNQSRLAIWMHDTLYKGALGHSLAVESYAEKLSSALYKVDSGMKNVPIPNCPVDLGSNCFSFSLPFTERVI